MTTIRIREIRSDEPPYTCDALTCEEEAIWRTEAGSAVTFMCLEHAKEWVAYTMEHSEDDR